MIKKSSIIVFAIFLVCCVLQSTPKTINGKTQIKEFSLEDTKVLGIGLDMKKAELEKTLGKPKRIESQYEGAFGVDVLHYFYDFGSLRLEPVDQKDYSVAEIIIDRPNFKGPRDIQVNDALDTVIERFPNNKCSSIEDNRRFLYGEEDDNCGFILYDSSGKRVKTVFYKFGPDGFGGYTLRFEIQNNRVKRIGIFVMNV